MPVTIWRVKTNVAAKPSVYRTPTPRGTLRRKTVRPSDRVPARSCSQSPVGAEAAGVATILKTAFAQERRQGSRGSGPRAGRPRHDIQAARGEGGAALQARR